MSQKLLLACAIFICAPLLLSLKSYGQQGGIKFGKIDKEFLEMTTYAKDTGASAVVLADYGVSYFRYNDHKSDFQIIFEKHTRIKILNKDGYDQADQKIYLYHSNNQAKESVSNLKGFTYNLENGKIVKDKLEKSSIFEEEYTESLDIKKFTMPNVKVGSVIEFSYTITSDFLYNFQPWEFQKSIPVMWSEYKTIIPEYFHYKQMQQGFLTLTLNEYTTESGHINLKNSNSQSGVSRIDLINHVSRFGISDVPALKEENFVSNMEDYRTKIIFELSSLHYPNSTAKNVMDTWETMNTKLLQEEKFGLQLNRKGFIKDHAESLTAKYGNEPKKEQVKQAVNFVKQKIKWNEKYRILTTQNARKAFEEGLGSSADINFTLILLLREMGIQADPVIISTRTHGKINPGFPIVNKFNNTLAVVDIDGKKVLIDGTNHLLPYDEIPFNYLNGPGRVISENNPGWIDIQNPKVSQSYTKVDFKLDEDQILRGQVSISNTGYNASSVRSSIDRKGNEEYLKDKMEKVEDFEIEDFSNENLDNPDEAYKESYTLSLAEEIMESIIYINPMLIYGEDENPFKLEKRLFPVDFGSKLKDTYIFTLELPEGYVIDELPTKELIALPNNAGIFRFSSSVNGNRLTIMSTYSISQTVFLPEEYIAIKEFFSKMVTKHNEQIVLKRNT